MKQCEGYRRYGGAFSLGPVTWEQCKKVATVLLTISEGSKEQTLPSCQVCWDECLQNNIKVIRVKPIIK